MWKCLLICAAIALTAMPLHAQAPNAARAEAGWQAVQAGDGERAATAFREALIQDPRDPTLHFGAGIAAHLLGRDTDAMQALKRALQLEPRLIGASVLLGDIEHHEGDVDAAIRTYEQALARAPANPSLRARLDAWRNESAVHDTLEQWSDHRFSVVFDGQVNRALGKRGFDVLDAAYWRIGKALGAYPSERIVVTLYSEQQFRDITHAPAWSGGLFDGRIRVPVKGAAQNLPQFDRVLAHELTHAMVSSLANRGVPGWLHEGLASYFEPRDPALAARHLKAMGVAVPLANLQGGFSGLGAAEAVIAYEESLVAADVLVKRLGTYTAILIQYLGKGQTFDESLSLLGVAPSEFESALMRRLR
jgi:tetratricopeptide (TPR) repeat protein